MKIAPSKKKTTALDSPLADVLARESVEIGGLIGNKYKVLALLGTGGTGRVYLCEHLRMRRKVAIKFLSAEICADPDRLADFGQEAQTLAMLDHPNIVRAFDLDRDGELHYLVMEYVGGVCLSELVKTEGPLAPEQAVNFALQVAEGLRYAHEAGWVHRDIKPQNLLLAANGTIKILDLGLAMLFRSCEPSKIDSQTGPILGTPDYLAPEQALDCRRVDWRADVYSLGATMYFLLAGKPPFHDRPRVAAKLIAHQTADPVPLHTLVPTVPEGLAQFVHKLLVKRPTARPTLARILEDLRSYPDLKLEVGFQERKSPTTVSDMDRMFDTDAQPILVLPAADKPKPQRTAQTRLVKSIVAHRGPVRVLTFSGDDRFLASGGQDAAVRLWDVKRRLSDCGKLHDSMMGGIQALTFAPRGTCLLVANDSPKSTLWRWEYSEHGGQRTSPISDVLACSDALVYSPTGHLLASALGSQVVLRDGSNDRYSKRAVLESNFGDVKALAFAPDGRMLACGCQGSVQLWKQSWLTGWATGLPLVAHSQGTTALEFSPDGRFLASAGGDQTIRVWAIESRNLVHTFSTPGSTASCLRFAEKGTLLTAALADGRIAQYDLRRKVLAREWHLPLDDEPVKSCVVLSRDGSRIAIGTVVGKIMLYHLEQ